MEHELPSRVFWVCSLNKFIIPRNGLHATARIAIHVQTMNPTTQTKG